MVIEVIVVIFVEEGRSNNWDTQKSSLALSNQKARIRAIFSWDILEYLLCSQRLVITSKLIYFNVKILSPGYTSETPRNFKKQTNKSDSQVPAPEVGALALLFLK